MAFPGKTKIMWLFSFIFPFPVGWKIIPRDKKHHHYYKIVVSPHVSWTKVCYQQKSI